MLLIFNWKKENIYVFSIIKLLLPLAIQFLCPSPTPLAALFEQSQWERKKGLNSRDEHECKASEFKISSARIHKNFFAGISLIE